MNILTRLRALYPYAISMIIFTLLVNVDQTFKVALKHAGLYSGIFLTLCVFICFYWDRFAKSNRVIHTQIGLLSIALFLLHTDFNWPDGKLELFLTLMFVLLAVSGIFGAFIATTLTKRLRHLPASDMCDDIVKQREIIRKQSEAVLLKAIKSTHSELIEQLYIDHLHDYFWTRTNSSAHLFGVSQIHLYPFTFIEMALNKATTAEQTFIVQLAELAQRKFNLDKQYTSAQANDFWRLFHQKIAWCLIILVLVHSLLAISFTGLAL